MNKSSFSDTRHAILDSDAFKGITGYEGTLPDAFHAARDSDAFKACAFTECRITKLFQTV